MMIMSHSNQSTVITSTQTSYYTGIPGDQDKVPFIFALAGDQSVAMPHGSDFYNEFVKIHQIYEKSYRAMEFLTKSL